MRLIFSLLFLMAFCLSCSSTKEQSAEQKKAEIYYSQGTADLVRKDYTSALSNLYQAIQLDTNNAKIHNNLGMAYYFKNRKNLAIIHIQKSLEIDPTNSEARNNFASILYEMGKADEAEIEYKKIQDDVAYPYQYQISYYLGLLQQKKGQSSAAMTYFQQAINENPNYCRAHFSLGQLSLASKNYSNAYSSFFKASQGECYKEPDPQYYQAVSLLGQKKWVEAKLKLEEILDRFPATSFAKMAKKELSSLEQKLGEEDFTKTEKSDKKSSSTYQSRTF